ncbi:hypothetical protein ACFWRZ_09095 [Streptomyces rubiginosohelvolus]|uniref:hypothetical protein n=1 Tax=Streptomyces rubiginosohelvolus TaxID=67362 RepID=UPI0036671A35
MSGTAPIQVHHHAVFEHRVLARPGIYEDRLVITAPRLGTDPVDRYFRPSSRDVVASFPMEFMLRSRGWRTVGDVEYIAGRNCYRAPVEPVAGVVVPAQVVCADAQVRTVTHVTFRTGEPDRYVVQHGAEWIARDCAPSLRTCVHGEAAGHHATGNPVTACARKESVQEAGVFNDEGCVEAFDCVVQAANEAARLNAEEGVPGEEPPYTWLPICVEHAEQAADSCEACPQD